MLIGIDEAGRGPLAGPVIAAAVGWHHMPEGILLRDSKLLSLSAREKAFRVLTTCTYWSIGSASAQEIDTLNIRQATLLAMTRAAHAFKHTYSSIIIDGLDVPHALKSHASALIKADQKVPEVSAASIIAKVFRDRLMCALADIYPLYAFEKHKGYPTALHRTHIQTHGLSPLHRRSFNNWQ